MRPVIINGFSTPVMDQRYMLCTRNQIFLIQKSYTAGFEDNAIHDIFVRNKFPQHVGSLRIRSFPNVIKYQKVQTLSLLFSIVYLKLICHVSLQELQALEPYSNITS